MVIETWKMIRQWFGRSWGYWRPNCNVWSSKAKREIRKQRQEAQLFGMANLKGYRKGRLRLMKMGEKFGKTNCFTLIELPGAFLARSWGKRPRGGNCQRPKRKNVYAQSTVICIIKSAKVHQVSLGYCNRRSSNSCLKTRGNSSDLSWILLFYSLRSWD